MDLKIYVSYFNPFQIIPQNSVLIPVQAGKEKSKNDLNILGDNTGENISSLNNIYSELTVLFWVWKNCQASKYVGFCHYRRFFDFNNKEYFPLPYKKHNENELLNFNVLPQNNVIDLLNNYDLIIPRKIVMPHSLKRNYEKNHNAQHIVELRNTIYKLFPEYLPSFDYTFEKTNKLPPYNMFVAKWELFHQYCNFIFTIFADLQKDIKIPEDKHQQRIFGFMSERLLAVFIEHHKLKTKEILILLFNKNAKERSKFTFYFGNLIKNINFRIRLISKRF